MVSKGRCYFAIFLFLLITNCVFSQQKNNAKTIFELFHINQKGCDVLPVVESISEEEVSFYSTEPKLTSEIVPTDLNLLVTNWIPLFQRDSALVAKYQKPIELPVKFDNGNCIYKENDLYGLKDSRGLIILPAKFHTLLRDDNKGFVAYENQYCNYYTSKGEKLLNSDFFYIKRTFKNTFIVQTKSGFGVILPNNKYVIPPTLLDISAINVNGFLYYWLQKSEKQGFYLSENTKDTIALNERSDVGFLDADYWELYGRLINIKSKKYVICESGYNTSVLSAKHHLASVEDPQSGLQYLIDFNGKLITNTSFSRIGEFNKKDFAIAVKKDDSNTKISMVYYGVINDKGNWVVAPSYLSLEFINDSMAIARDKRGLYGVVDSRDNIAVPFRYSRVVVVNEKYILGIVSSSGDVNSELIQMSDYKTVKKNLPYKYVRPTELCKKSVFIAETEKGECLLNESFDPVSSMHFDRIFYGPNKDGFVGTNFSDNSVSESHLFNCDGVMESFVIEGKTYDSFKSYSKVFDLQHILLNSDTGYFISSNGNVVSSNFYYQDITYSKVKDLYVTMISGGKYGVVNSCGETVIPPVFDYISTFNDANGLAYYNYNGKQKGFLNSNGELLFGLMCQDAKDLGFGLFKVMKSDKWGVVNRSGKVVVPLNYSSINILGGLIKASDGNTITFFDINGNFIQ